MRTITITKNVYKYDELNAKAQERVRKWYLAQCRTPELFSEMLDGDLEMIFGKNDLDVEYSLNRCQGDGLNVYGTIRANAIIKCLDNHNGGTMFNEFEDVLTEDEKQFILGLMYNTIEIPANGGNMYCMAHRICLRNWEYENDWSSSHPVVCKFEQLVINMFYKLCKMYEDWGYDYFYDVDDDALSEECEANGWEFTEDGELYV